MMKEYILPTKLILKLQNESEPGWTKIMVWLIINVTYQFSSKSGIVFFVGVFVPWTRSKNYEI
jgi:hypothetical protein